MYDEKKNSINAAAEAKSNKALHRCTQPGPHDGGRLERVVSTASYITARQKKRRRHARTTMKTIDEVRVLIAASMLGPRKIALRKRNTRKRFGFIPHYWRPGADWVGDRPVSDFNTSGHFLRKINKHNKVYFFFIELLFNYDVCLSVITHSNC